MKINCIIIEDEPLALERTRDFVQKLPGLTLLGTFENALEALDFLSANRVDLIFLDINLGEFSGLDLLETNAVTSQVIVTTAYHEFALKGFDLNVTDYLLKPFTFERFVQAVGRVRERFPKKQSPAPRNSVFVKVENRLERINLRDIIFIEGMRDYRRIQTVQKSLLTLQTFTEFEQQIPAQIICRVHKSYMVALEKIDSIEKDRIKIGNRLIPLSETYKPRLFALIKPK